MKVLVLVKDPDMGKIITQGLETQGHDPVLHTDWEQALEQVRDERYPIVFIGPQFLANPDYNAATIRANSRGYVYVIGVSVEGEDDQVKSGLNNLLPTASNSQALEDTVNTAVSFVLRFDKLANDSEDFLSAGGVISKSAFNQLFLSALDRTGRYSEAAYVLFFSVENYKTILVNDGEYAAQHAAARLAYHLSKTRRQSDVLGQIAENEYALLFLRPEYQDEPLDAADRFFETLSRLKDYISGVNSVDISLKLLELPSGNLKREHSFSVSAR